MGDGDDHSKELRRSCPSRSENAETRMKYGSVDALSELVWSPRNGLSLRCADFSFTGKGKLLSPRFFDDSHMESHSKSISMEEKEASFRVDRTDDEVNQACSGVNRPISGVGGSVEDMKPEIKEMDEDKVETNDDSVEAEKRVGSSNRSSGENDSPRGETEALMASEQLRLERAGSQEEPTNIGDKTALDAERVEATDENDLSSPTSKALVVCESKGECLPQDETDAEKAGPSGHLTKAKGKEKALSDGNFDDDESFGSVESCNSAGLLTRGKKRPGFEQQLILGSKRLKTLSQECLESTSKLKQDSSFVNWISNMTKGIWKGNEEDKSPFVALTTASDAKGQVNAIVDLPEMSRCRNTGFQSFFQSIYCQKKSDQDAVKMDSSNDANIASLQELPEHCLNTKGDHLSSSGNKVAPVAEPSIGFNQTNETFCSEKKYEEEQKACCEADEKVVQCLTNKNSALESLWISRFSSKSSFPQKKDFHERITKEVAKEANDPPQNNAILPIVSSLRIESSEAMASLFARRLEAMKHMLPTCSLGDNTEEGQRNLICFYCGKKSHRLQDCLEVTDTELRDLVQNINARNGRKEGSSLCIRCFQLSHWAATCPNAPPYSSGAEGRAIASTSGTKLPFRGFTDVPKTVFEAVQVLRLTRTDVLKWINSKKSVSGLEGFFLRLRLGKWAEGLGGTGYHVARIEGAPEGQSSKKHPLNSSVSVKVGGITCFVESQFISNHDFLEEELLAWWRSAGKSAGRSGGEGIPSAEELSRKIQQRKMLGF
ncbi:unnamed protein product [Eruca vesicaria subsp. sativa]|uniref:Zinc knuckle (CCHC-type) family protein n=1 Tax=Eruca vesicaria subsp. sativa TaxID=29727 RepID=A0ABC8JLI9_ERUVS|nr:unnamed protein product [Eruca vesicaria subsp. sativa]